MKKLSEYEKKIIRTCLERRQLELNNILETANSVLVDGLVRACQYLATSELDAIRGIIEKFQ